jgi:hypothetical protein
MAKRSKSVKKQKIRWSDLQGVLDGCPRAFKTTLNYLSYDEKGRNVLEGYLRRTERQLKRLPDSEYGDLVSEAHKQVWRCAGRYLARKATGEKSTIAFRVYYYQRLKQCFTDRVRATQKKSDVHNTHALSADALMEDSGFDLPGSSVGGDVPARIDINLRIQTLGKHERTIVKKLDDGWTPTQIKRELIDRLVSKKPGRNYDDVAKLVRTRVDQSLAVIRSVLEDVWGAYDEDHRFHS